MYIKSGFSLSKSWQTNKDRDSITDYRCDKRLLHCLSFKSIIYLIILFFFYLHLNFWLKHKICLPNLPYSCVVVYISHIKSLTNLPTCEFISTFIKLESRNKLKHEFVTFYYSFSYIKCDANFFKFHLFIILAVLMLHRRGRWKGYFCHSI